MKLLPASYRKIGLVLTFIGFTALILGQMGYYPVYSIYWYSFSELSATEKLLSLKDELIWTFLLIGLSFIGFARLKNEDEFFDHLRLKAAFTAIAASVIFGILSNWIFYNDLFVNVAVVSIIIPVFTYNVAFWILYLINSVGNNEK